jgi:hypothetical protein
VQVSGDRAFLGGDESAEVAPACSTSATDQPDLASSAAATMPFTPEPITTASTVRVMDIS